MADKNTEKRDKDKGKTENKKKDKDLKKKEEQKEVSDDGVILMGAPAPKKEIAKPKEKKKTQLSPKKEDTDSKKIEEEKPIEITNNVVSGNGSKHLNLGRLFFVLAILFLLFLGIGNASGWFGKIDIDFLSFWPLTFIFLGLLLFKVKTPSGKLLGVLVVLFVFLASLGVLARGGDIVNLVLSEEIALEERQIEEFNAIVFEGVGDIEIIQGDKRELFIEADRNVLGQVRTEVTDGVLRISYRSPLWGLLLFNDADINIGLTTPKLEAVHLLGSGNILSAGISGDSLDISIAGSGNIGIANVETEHINARITGSGNISLGGQVKQQIVVISGSGTYLANDLQSDETGVRISGSGNVEIAVNSVLDVSISGSGDVVYSGTPQLRKGVVSGSGTIQAREGEQKEALDPKEFYEKVKPVF